jgi:DNA-binding transcriptional ArsR family regulator
MLNTRPEQSGFPPDHLSAVFSALADPTRRAILASLTHGEASVLQLAQPFEMSLPAVSRHLKVLEKAGLIARSRDAQWRPCRLEAAPLKGVADWLDKYREFWEQSFDRLDDYLREIQMKSSRTSARKPTSPIQKGSRHGQLPKTRKKSR